MPTVYLSRRVPDRVRRELEHDFELILHDSETPPTRAELLARAAGMDGLVTMLTDRVDDELLDAAGSQLRAVANYAVGFDNVDVEACTGHGVVASNTPDVLTGATAELTMTLILALVRRVAEGDRFVRAGTPWIWAPTMMLGTGLSGKTLGIVGLGRIGLEVARLGTAFGMRAVYTDEAGPRDVPYAFTSFERVLVEADVISLHTPLTPATRHLVGAAELETMKATAYLVNSSRGPVIDEEALAEALATGQIAGAALDVFEREPAVTARLLELDNVVLVPHLGSATGEVRDAMGMLCVEALRSILLAGVAPPNALNPEALQPTAAANG